LSAVVRGLKFGAARMGFGVRITMRIQTLYSVTPKLALHLATLTNPSRFRLVDQSRYVRV